MRISLAGQAFVGSWEWDGKEGRVGDLFFPYYDYVGKRFVKIGDLVSARRYLTIGWGHVVKAGEDFSAGVTLDRLHSIFESDLLGVELAIDQYVTAPYGLTQTQYDALVDFGHNLGAGRLRPENNTMIRLLNAGDYGAVARIDAAGNVQGHILDWDVVNGVHDPGLLERRRQEGRMWCSISTEEADERAAALHAESVRIAAERAASVQFSALDLLPSSEGRE